MIFIITFVSFNIGYNASIRVNLEFHFFIFIDLRNAGSEVY